MDIRNTDALRSITASIAAPERTALFINLNAIRKKDDPMAHILIVDDEDTNRDIMRRMLTDQGHSVVEAINGDHGLKTFRSENPDLIVTDILMPVKGGLALILDVRKVNPSQKVLAISGGGKDGRLQFLATARAIKGVSTLQKPFYRDQFLEAVSVILED